MIVVKSFARVSTMLSSPLERKVSQDTRYMKTVSTLAPPIYRRWPLVGGGVVMAGTMVYYWWTRKILEKGEIREEGSERRKQFCKFASQEFNGVLYMTPHDFIESVIADHPRPR